MNHIEIQIPDIPIELLEKVDQAPEGPGCYLFKNKTGYIIYVGKGKSIRNRVRQYFQRSRYKEMQDKIRHLVRAVVDVEFVETATELDALLEEYRLIKKHKPWFNSQLKADKIHPYLRIQQTGQQYATLSVCNERQVDGAYYYGSFYDEDDAKAALEIISRAWKTPTCAKAVFLPGKRACLRYHLGTCLAPCEAKIAPEAYEKVINEVTCFLGGDGQNIYKRLKKQMSEHVAELQFEAAATCKSHLEELEYLQRKCSKIYHFPLDQDTILLIRPYHYVGCTVVYIRKGCAIARKDFPGKLDDDGLKDLVKQIEICEPLDQDRWLEKGLAEIYAEKLFLSIPTGKGAEEIIRSIHTEYARLRMRSE